MNPGFRSLMWYLLVGTRGGPNRVRLLQRLHETPANAHQLAASLELDYRTIRHHLRLLERNGAISRPVKDAYAAPYELAPYLAEHFDLIEEMLPGRSRPRPRTARASLPAISVIPGVRRGSP